MDAVSLIFSYPLALIVVILLTLMDTTRLHPVTQQTGSQFPGDNFNKTIVMIAVSKKLV